MAKCKPREMIGLRPEDVESFRRLAADAHLPLAEYMSRLASMISQSRTLTNDPRLLEGKEDLQAAQDYLNKLTRPSSLLDDAIEAANKTPDEDLIRKLTRWSQKHKVTIPKRDTPEFDEWLIKSSIDRLEGKRRKSSLYRKLKAQHE